MEDNFQSAYQEEEDRLNSTLTEIDSILTRLKSTPVYTGHDYTEQVLEDSREQRRKDLAKLVHEPYFGRLDFQGSGEGEARPLYIGKIGVDREQVSDRPLVIDWRAPVASLFYSFTGGTEPASYEAPEGLIEGLVYLKRNVVIRKQILERVADTYNRNSDAPTVSDEFLVYRLGENKDNRLRDIVSTIQEEQDRIIRAVKNTALIIQGVAGSGKTTVALHRLAFLLYQYKEQVSAERMIIFAPNRMFLDYISDVLPELGVGNIAQSTFPDWAAAVLSLELPEQNAAETLNRWFEAEGGMPAITEETPGRFKGSTVLMEVIESAVRQLETGAVPEGDFIPWEGAVLRRSMILRWHNEEYAPYPPLKRKERVMARIHRWIEMELKKSPSAAALKERKKKAAAREKTYSGKWPKYNPLMIYKQIFRAAKVPEDWPAEAPELIPQGVLKETVKELKKGILREEDLPPLLYIHYLLSGNEGTERFDHIVIDEAQDFSPFQIAVLDLYVKGHSFTILGDLSQGIHAYKGVHEWSEMSTLFAPEHTAYHALTRSYRSTMEIIEFANGILSAGVQSPLLAVPVFRSGNPVRLIDYSGEAPKAASGASQRLNAVRAALASLSGREYRTVAVLTRSLREAEELYAELGAHFADLHLIDGSMTEYHGGLSVLPVYLSKGLEFDAVILADADTGHYGEAAWDAKLMYVGCTRALHELWLLHGGDLPAYVQTAGEETVSGWPEPAAR
ncbi:helicase UvrD [Paenibacillus sp. FSL R7-0273]|uniref:HelD family protein n=1 Tax=Paenibacillus sp. FSL R7-0273 TaxID=1536772 RepID=UPI0004F5BF11|nr:UvrD-helicase domain-containing protein [Paenibacillus sp. FSL R7-0273]AIQ48868.1 helicase UvrD [Paenibacillus sp. FSL R7-0273]OMF91254.1 DNA helicase UvrD [Paenibacillus sp. FSL R7-0273]